MDTNQQRELLEHQMLDESKRLKTLRYAVLDMLEDFIAEDVMNVNLQYVQPKLENITEARIQFRSAVKQFKRMFASSHSEKCSIMQDQLGEMHQQVRQHADNIS